MMKTIKVKILSSSFGFNKGDEVEATIHGKGFFVKNGHLGKFIPLSQAEVIGEEDE